MAAVKVLPLVASHVVGRPLLKEHSRRTGMMRGRLTSLCVRVIGDIKSISTSSVFSLGIPKPECQVDIKTNRWQRVIAEADKLLGYPKVTMPGQMLPGNDVTAMASELSTVLEPEHPLLKIFERFIQGQNNVQAKGLIILLLAKVVGQIDNPKKDSKEDIATKQDTLATGTDLANMAMQAHMAISNVNRKEADNVICDKLDYANKVAILIGDLLLAKANLLFGTIRNTQIAYMMSTAMRETVCGRFLYDQDDQGNAYPTKTITMADWEARSFMINSSLLANSCKASLLLNDLDDDQQNRGYQFGKLLGLAWQASAELEQFLDAAESTPTAPFSLVSCPVVLHLQRDSSLLDLLAPYRNDLSKVDYKKIYEMVSDSPAVREAQEICQNHVQGALNLLQHFPHSEPRVALENIVASLEV